MTTAYEKSLVHSRLYARPYHWSGRIAAWLLTWCLGAIMIAAFVWGFFLLCGAIHYTESYIQWMAREVAWFIELVEYYLAQGKACGGH